MILLVPKFPFWPLSDYPNTNWKQITSFQFWPIQENSCWFSVLVFRRRTLVAIIPAEVLTSMPLSASLLIIVAKLTHWSRWPSHTANKRNLLRLLDLSNFINKSWIFMLLKVLFASKDFYIPIKKMIMILHISNIHIVNVQPCFFQ